MQTHTSLSLPRHSIRYSLSPFKKSVQSMGLSTHWSEVVWPSSGRRKHITHPPRATAGQRWVSSNRWARPQYTFVWPWPLPAQQGAGTHIWGTVPHSEKQMWADFQADRGRWAGLWSLDGSHFADTGGLLHWTFGGCGHSRSACSERMHEWRVLWITQQWCRWETRVLRGW